MWGNRIIVYNYKSRRINESSQSLSLTVSGSPPRTHKGYVWVWVCAAVCVPAASALPDSWCCSRTHTGVQLQGSLAAERETSSDFGAGSGFYIYRRQNNHWYLVWAKVGSICFHSNPFFFFVFFLYLLLAIYFYLFSLSSYFLHFSFIVSDFLHFSLLNLFLLCSLLSSSSTTTNSIFLVYKCHLSMYFSFFIQLSPYY